ncbi:MAG TPA: hypothetical protein V6C89_07345 [Drouetiella sp.]|jgi:uncharacterized protein
MSLDHLLAQKEKPEQCIRESKTLTVLCSLLGLFCLRVIGQLLVATCHVPFLPPMTEWQSGLLPYPVLLICQALIIGIYGKVCIDFYRRNGFFYKLNPVLAAPLRAIGMIYFVAVALRLLIWMTIFEHHPWFSGTIPIFFHFILSTFLIVLAQNHCRAIASAAQSSTHHYLISERRKVSL